MNRLSVTKVRTLSTPGAYADGNGLYLQVRKGGDNVFKSWIFRYMRQGVAHNMGLGSIRIVSLAEARIAAAEAQKKLFHGSDPIESKRQTQAVSKAPTFKDAAKTFITIHTPTWKNAKHATQWTNTLKEYAEPVIGKRSVDQIDRSHIIRILEPIWLEKRETATRVRGRIEKVLDWATVEGYRSGPNPAQWKGNLEHSLPKQLAKQRTRHLAALPWKELPDFYDRLCSQEGIAAQTLRFTILTAARTGEVRFATPDEFDLNENSGLWTIPKERMKAGKEHRVPLPDPAVLLLQQVASNNQYVFSPFPEKSMSENAMLALLKRMKVTGITVHGFRSTFRDWAAEKTTIQPEVIEACLAHTNTNQVEAAYLRSDILEKRRTLMSKWNSFVTEKESTNRTCI
jgi:integrase